MVIGKTSPSISLTDILSKYSEVQILKAVFPSINVLPCVINSPFRVDSNPSFSIFLTDNKQIRYKDFGDNSVSGGLWDLLSKYWNCSFKQSIIKVANKLSEKNKNGEITINSSPIKTFTRKESHLLTKIQVVVRKWRDYDYEYWRSYGIEPKWLKYANIYPISHKIVAKKECASDKWINHIFSADKYAYCFIEKKEGNVSLKIYQPFSKKFKWCSKMDASVIGLWTKIPEYGDKVIICSSLKDALCISCNLHIPTLCLQGEGYGMSDTAIKELKRRYKKVYISFDTDKVGKADSKKLAEKTGFINVIPDLGATKDYSDYFKSLKNKEDFKQLKQLFQ